MLGRHKVGLALLALLTGTLAFAYVMSCPLPKDSTPKVVTVEPGYTTRQVATLLQENGIIRNQVLFRILVRIMGADGKIQSGEFQFEPGIFAWDAVKSLVEGRVIYYTLTVREGLTVEQMADLVEERGFGSAVAFLEIVKDATLLPDYVSTDEVKDTRYPLEGYLFPDTYFVRKGVTERDLVSMMLARTSQVCTRDILESIRQAGLSPHEAFTMASIVEKEARAAEERPKIAAVYLNRLKIGMKLDADPTVMYAVGKNQGPVLWKDLEADSPYNTYRRVGLPPGPISNFGKASLEAVLNPDSVDFLYFVAKNDGTHAFARTLSEHNANVAQYQGH
jgi:UPF0755 protein